MGIQNLQREKKIILDSIDKFNSETKNISLNLNEKSKKIEEYSKEIRDCLSWKKIPKNTIQDLFEKKSKIEKEIDELRSQQDFYENQINELKEEQENLDNQILSESDAQDKLLKQANAELYLEEKTDFWLEDMIIKNEDFEDIIKIYKMEESGKLPEKFPLDKVFFFQWEKNSSKDFAVKIIWKELNRPLYKVNNEDSLNIEWFYEVFQVLLNFFAEQKNKKDEIKNEIQHIEKVLNNIKSWKFNEQFIYYEDLKEFSMNLDSNQNRNKAIGIMENMINQFHEQLDSIQAKFILQIDNFDKLINAGYRWKWNILEPINWLIREIKKLKLDVIVVITWKNWWNFDEDLKAEIDKVVEFVWIKDNYKEIFYIMLSKSFEEYDIDYLTDIKIPDLKDNFQNIRFLQDLINDFMQKIKLYPKSKLQDLLDKVLYKRQKDYWVFDSSIWFRSTNK